ncbi:hypothetical protein AB9G23_09660 [Francisella philomiragia]|uniref:hypothetical protein n=1 Tax=Francisella philomiragia TaxID=28110 RepID=UPI0019089C84|nr:hypothetical protein [Francisella philomiragia]MBK2025369.1 hypothetical protein [Francisella philomiragia]
MPQFNNAYYIALDNVSFDITTDTIDFAYNHRRKLVPNSDRVPLFRFDSEANYITNKAAAEKKLITFCEKIKNYSVIYINSHGHYDGQCIGFHTRANGKVEEVTLKIKDLITIMANSIPIKYHNNLKIHLIMCSSTAQAETFANLLARENFTKISVVGYTDDLQTGLGNSSLGAPGIGDFTTKDRIKKGVMEEGYNYHGKNYKSNKIVYHNYEGKLVCETDYKKFKQQHLMPSLLIKDKSPENIIEEKSNLLKLLDSLYKNVEEYIQYSKSHSSIWHGESGISRAMTFNKYLQKELVSQLNEEMMNDSFLSRNIEIKLIVNLYHLSRTQGPYKGISGSINVSEHSLMTYIIRALDNYYKNATNISPFLANFMRYLNCRDRRGIGSRPEGFYDEKTVFYIKDTETERERIRDSISEITQKKVDQW